MAEFKYTKKHSEGDIVVFFEGLPWITQDAMVEPLGGGEPEYVGPDEMARGYVESILYPCIGDDHEVYVKSFDGNGGVIATRKI